MSDALPIGYPPCFEVGARPLLLDPSVDAESVHEQDLQSPAPGYAENSDPNVLTMPPAEEDMRRDAPDLLFDRAQDRRILGQ